MNDARKIAPLPPPVAIPEDAEGSELRFFRYVAEQFNRHDELEAERRHDETTRRVRYEAERQEQAEHLTRISRSVEQVAEVCSALTHTIARVDARVDRIEGLVLGLRGRFDTIARQVESQGGDLHKLRLRLDALEAEVAEIKRRLEAHSPTERPTEPPPSLTADASEPGGES